jgi:anthranilate 1,2-dioxygenase small subunit
VPDPFTLISRTQAAYARCIDEGPLEEWPDFFVEDCFYKITSAENHRQGLEAGIVWADSRGMLVDRISALRDANIYERHTYRHVLSQPYLPDDPIPDHAAAGDVEIESETSFLVIRVTRDGTSELFASGRYLDRYRIGPRRALLARRTVLCDSSQIDTLLALPL